MTLYVLGWAETSKTTTELTYIAVAVTDGVSTNGIVKSTTAYPIPPEADPGKFARPHWISVPSGNLT